MTDFNIAHTKRETNDAFSGVISSQKIQANYPSRLAKQSAFVSINGQADR